MERILLVIYSLVTHQQEIRVKIRFLNLTAIVCCPELVRRYVFAGKYQMVGNLFWGLNSWIESINNSNKSNLV